MLLLPELIHLIALKLNFRSLLSLRRTCKKYSALLSELVKMRREALFKQFTVANETGEVLFVPGPAIPGLPKHFPKKGIYFFETDTQRREIHFFFKKFNKFLKSKTHNEHKYIATTSKIVV